MDSSPALIPKYKSTFQNITEIVTIILHWRCLKVSTVAQPASGMSFIVKELASC